MDFFDSDYYKKHLKELMDLFEKMSPWSKVLIYNEAMDGEDFLEETSDKITINAEFYNLYDTDDFAKSIIFGHKDYGNAEIAEFIKALPSLQKS